MQFLNEMVEESANVMPRYKNTQGKYDRRLQIFESSHVEDRMHFSLQLKP